jgi:hypothetical protein
VRFRREGDVQGSEVASASEQLARFINTDQRLRAISRTMYPPGSEYPTLHRLDVHVAHSETDGPTRALLDPEFVQSDPKKRMEILLKNFEDKKAKFDEYSDGLPVWLVLLPIPLNSASLL